MGGLTVEELKERLESASKDLKRFSERLSPAYYFLEAILEETYGVGSTRGPKGDAGLKLKETVKVYHLSITNVYLLPNTLISRTLLLNFTMHATPRLHRMHVRASGIA